MGKTLTTLKYGLEKGFLWLSGNGFFFFFTFLFGAFYNLYDCIKNPIEDDYPQTPLLSEYFS